MKKMEGRNREEKKLGEKMGGNFKAEMGREEWRKKLRWRNEGENRKGKGKNRKKLGKKPRRN